MSLSDLQRIGLFGGAFDPPHLAHTALARAVLQQFELDQLRVIPTGQAWHKSRTLSAAHHRVAMARLAFADLPRVHVDPQETQREGATFTIDTLMALQAQYPGAQWWVCIGEDQAARFATWHRWTEILQCAHLIVAPRPEAVRSDSSNPALQREWHNAWPEEVKPKIHVLNWLPQDLSATAIRDALARGHDASDALHPQVSRYIRQHHLYSDQHE